MLQRTQAGVALAVDDVGARRVPAAGFDERIFDQVLDGFDARASMAGQACDHARAEYFGGGGVDFAAGLAGSGDGMDDLGAVEADDTAVALEDFLGHHGRVLHVVLVWVGYYYIMWLETRWPRAMASCLMQRNRYAHLQFVCEESTCWAAWLCIIDSCNPRLNSRAPSCTIVRASCRERVCQYGLVSVVAV